MGFDPKQIIDLLHKYKSGTLSVEEDGILRNWVGQSLDNQAFFNEVDQDDQYFSHLHEDMVSRLRVFEAVKGKTGDFSLTPPTKTVRLSPVFRWVAAASVLVLLTAGYTYYRSTNPPTFKQEITTVPAVKADVLPGTNKAILVLSNGSKITLDSVANGVVASQGNAQVHKLSNGQLAYTAASKAASELIYNTLNIPRGGQYQLTLPDKSKVWLNSESTLSYPVAFGASERKVKLIGQGYFEIAADASRSFQVETPKGSTQVLGTTFDISSYPDDRAELTTLLTGKLKVNTSSKSLVLQPGEQSVDAGSSVVIKHPNLKTVTAWRRGFFSFSEADALTIVKQLARWYNVDYKFEGVVSTEKVDGLIGRDLKLSEALTVLRTLHINATLVDRTIIIRP